ncbi:hypothetical protein RSAG8_00319, partial [Rhizoctonia solani AG-8 WAC10335]
RITPLPICLAQSNTWTMGRLSFTVSKGSSLQPPQPPAKSCSTGRRLGGLAYYILAATWLVLVLVQMYLTYCTLYFGQDLGFGF